MTEDAGGDKKLLRLMSRKAFSLTCYLNWETNDKKTLPLERSGGRVLQLQRQASAKSLGWEQALCVWGTDKVGVAGTWVGSVVWGEGRKAGRGYSTQNIRGHMGAWIFIPRSAMPFTDMQTSDFFWRAEWCPGESVNLRMKQTLVWISSSPPTKHDLKQIFHFSELRF